MKKSLFLLFCIGTFATMLVAAKANPTSNEPNTTQKNSYLTPTQFPEPTQNPSYQQPTTPSNTTTNTPNATTPDTQKSSGSNLQKADFPKTASDIPKCNVCGGAGGTYDHGVWVDCPKCKKK